ncbi:MAG: hypothetical protein K9J12_12990 [Melioribacteraceae bacterium]|nr:hypothetical protein [Melioribacteraceae bacterium]
MKQPLFKLFLITIFISSTMFSQENSFGEKFLSKFEFREIGPFRGGRSAAVTGVPSKPMTYYFGATGGGVWKTTNGGNTWENISDGFFGGSIGAVAVSEWDPNVIYVGGGEKTVRGNVSSGYGMWKSTDAGKTWKNIGLNDSRHIPRIKIHPRNPDLVYAAVLGHLYGLNEERGVFRSKDGGETWEKILFVNSEVGAVNLSMDPVNPRNLYAGMWKVKRTPYSLESGGDGSGLWKSTDSGDSWTEITRNEGLPKGTIGIVGVAVSPVNNNLVWTIIENKDGGLFKSTDAGETWRKTNSERNLRQRAWYYTRVYADTKNEDEVYVLNVGFWKSKDGGKKFERIRTPHGDHHDLWINPDEPDYQIIGDDGGAQVTFDGGGTWSTYHNQPTAQFYRVTADNHFPYRIYGAQQDNSTVRILHRSDGRTISEDDWESTAGGESGWIAPHPENPDIVYGGSYGGYLTRYNHKTKEFRAVNVWPDDPMGHGAKDWKYRFQWNFPIIISQHNSDVIYTAGNVLFKSTNEGQSWEAISPDLTRNDSTKLGPSGGPITKDNTSVEYYCTIFTLAESKFDKNVIWVGSDDGLIHLTKDGGGSWQNITPDKKIMPEWIQINSIEADPFNEAGLYVAATNYKNNDFKPYLYKTDDYGKTWTKIVKGIDVSHFTRDIVCDPNRKGMLFAGTETGLYLSLDDGKSWSTFQNNLPVVPITDLEIKDNDLIIATQGRSFWLLDDLTPLHQWNDKISETNQHLFQPRSAFRMGGGRTEKSVTAGQNVHNGAVFNYYFNSLPDSNQVSFNIKELNGEMIQSFRPKADKKKNVIRMNFDAGLNQLVWNMRYQDADKFDGMILWNGGGLRGPKAVPGKYLAELIVADDTVSAEFEILKDPRSSASIADLKEQFDFQIDVRDKLSNLHNVIKKLRKVRSQIKEYVGKADGFENTDSLIAKGKTINNSLTNIEKVLYQTKNESAQDPLNFPIRLNDKLAAVASGVSYGDNKPTDQSYEVRRELYEQIDKKLLEFDEIIKHEVPKFNMLVKEANIPAVKIDEQ